MEITYSKENINSFGGINFTNYIFDYDNQFIPTDEYDSKRSYKKAYGYFPVITTIENHPVYIENRNGNSNVKYKQNQNLERAIFYFESV